MARLSLFVEGLTEQTFADTVLKPHLANFGVYMQKPTLIAHSRRRGRIHRGGGRNFPAMQNDINCRLKQESVIQLHEFEAYLFCDVSLFAFFFDNADSQISALHDVQPPERIDDGQHTAPSKRIIAQFPEYESSKTTVGPQMAEQIGLENICSKCPHFKAWVERLEKLGAPERL